MQVCIVLPVAKGVEEQNTGRISTGHPKRMKICILHRLRFVRLPTKNCGMDRTRQSDGDRAQTGKSKRFSEPGASRRR